MRRLNPTLRQPLTEEQIAANRALVEESLRTADTVNASFLSAQKSQQAAATKSALAEKTGLKVEQIEALKLFFDLYF